MKTRKASALVVLLALTLIAVWSVPATAGRLRGRDFVQQGEPAKAAGTLSVDAQGEWYLTTADNTVLSLHLGPAGFYQSKGLVLTAGAEATVWGFHLNNDLAVGRIETGGTTVTLRDTNGRPLWSGSSYARGQRYNPLGNGQGPGRDSNS